MEHCEYNSRIISAQIIRNGKIDIVVSGNCMAPLINNGDRISVYSIPKFKIGDIVLVYSAGMYRLHRLVYMKRGMILTKGDNMDDFDCNTDLSNVLAVYTGENKRKRMIALLSYCACQYRTKHPKIAKIFLKLKCGICRTKC